MKYPAIITKEGKYTLAEFPDLPGCQTFVETGEDSAAKAADALDGWLAVGLEDGEAPPRPSRRVRGEHDVLRVPVSPNVGVALAIRWIRHDRNLTQTELATLVGVSQQQIAKLERVQSNVTLKTLTKVAGALNHEVRIELAPAG